MTGVPVPVHRGILMLRAHRAAGILGVYIRQFDSRNRYSRYVIVRELDDRQLDALRVDVRGEQLRRRGALRICSWCHSDFWARAGAVYCSGRCRVASFRDRQTTQRIAN